MEAQDRTSPFSDLTPALALDAVDEAYGISPENSFTTYPSYANRVFGLRCGDGREYVVKFYRPGRWTERAIREEHSFVAELAEAEIPVVAPLPGLDGDTLQTLVSETEAGETLMPFALLPKRGGRLFDSEGEGDLYRLGALAGRMHRVGAARAARERIAFVPGLAERHLATLEREGVIHPDAAGEFVALCRAMARRYDGDVGKSRRLRIHGDLHRGNVLSRGVEGLTLIDFDDMAMGPAVQDLWLLMPDRLRESRSEMEAVLEGYETFVEFDRSELAAIESLRFLRMIHYLAWQAAQRFDEGFSAHFPDWGTRSFWIREIEDFGRQAEEMEAL